MLPPACRYNLRASLQGGAMDINELMNANRPLTAAELAFMEEEVLKLAKELQAEVAQITATVDPEHRFLADRLRCAAARTVENIEKAIAVPMDIGESHQA
jgi:hypothetical protein